MGKIRAYKAIAALQAFLKKFSKRLDTMQQMLYSITIKRETKQSKNGGKKYDG